MMNQHMKQQIESTMSRSYYYLSGSIIWVILFIILFIAMTVDACTENEEGKYHIYTANKHYTCNHFQISGSTIYFTDVNGNNVCISGDFTLIYETENKTQSAKESAP